mmetsp:Transcript_23149/g.68220  ORF Transcript_23149/g.68220 Transcript_23149/m.68220 type:complete len:252 (+) Transcript_23149:273-1028(+)
MTTPSVSHHNARPPPSTTRLEPAARQPRHQGPTLKFASIASRNASSAASWQCHGAMPALPASAPASGATGPRSATSKTQSPCGSPSLKGPQMTRPIPPAPAWALEKKAPGPSTRPWRKWRLTTRPHSPSRQPDSPSIQPDSPGAASKAVYPLPSSQPLLNVPAAWARRARAAGAGLRAAPEVDATPPAARRKVKWPSPWAAKPPARRPARMSAPGMGAPAQKQQPCAPCGGGASSGVLDAGPAGQGARQPS